MATAYLNPDPLPMIIDSIDLMEIMMQFFFLAQRLENIREELVTAATKSGGVSFLRAIGDGAEPPDAVFKETWTSLKYWVGIHSDVPWIESTDFPEPEYLTVKDFNRIAEWVSHSCKILNDFMAKFPNEKVRKVTLEEKRASNGEVSLDMLRVSMNNKPQAECDGEGISDLTSVETDDTYDELDDWQLARRKLNCWSRPALLS